MFIAMNRFRIVKGKEAEFERIWAERDSHLDDVAGFEKFNLLRGPETENHTLYASHTVWSKRIGRNRMRSARPMRARGPPRTSIEDTPNSKGSRPSCNH